MLESGIQHRRRKAKIAACGEPGGYHTGDVQAKLSGVGGEVVHGDDTILDGVGVGILRGFAVANADDYGVKSGG